ncbi:preprotein translocase subunit Sec61beta [archaeon]|nr:preprotein translocase subunit Sec61beta [archaeon]
MAKQQAPMSTGGIMRYFKDYKSKIIIKPGYVVLFSIVLIVAVIMLHALA